MTEASTRPRLSPTDPGATSRTLAAFIFASRWLQAPLYLGLIVAQAIYVVLFFIELWHLIEDAIIAGNITEVEVMLSVLALIDIVMIANLLIMVIIGGYETFVSKISLRGHPDRPDWLSHINANLLKVKLAVSIISISSIHLLTTFIEVGRMDGGLVLDSDGEIVYSSEGVMWEIAIHLAFIVSALALTLIDRFGQAPARSRRHSSQDEVPAPRAAEREDRGARPVDDDGFVTVRVPAGTALSPDWQRLDP